jgi:hypothetical protein
VDLAAGQMEGDRQTVEVGFEVNFAAKAAARAPKSLALLPPFGTDSGHVCPNGRAVEHLHQMCGFAGFGQQLEERLHHTGTAEPPEPFPDAIPKTERGRQSALGQIVNCEKMQCFQKPAVVAPWLATARLGRGKHLQHDLPVIFRHSRQHRPASLLPVC